MESCFARLQTKTFKLGNYMSNPVIIIHGWSDDSDSFIPLGQWLTANGFQVVDIHLGNYLSMNDDLTMFDLGLAFIRALDANKIPQTRHSFDVIVHSTGGLVIREYLRQVCDGNPANTPVCRLLMLSPANFGSPLATVGKSVMGRLVKGWGWDHLWQTGQQILNALELASPYSWALAEADLFDPSFNIFDPNNVMVTVFAGTAAYDNALRRTLHENGSDGTVRASTANLNAHFLKLSFENPDQPTLKIVPRNCPAMAFAVFNRDHTAIHDPADPRQADDWKRLVLQSLSINPGDYAKHTIDCSKMAALTFAAGANSPNPDWYHQYQHVVFRVKDQFGQPIPDYIVEFYQENGDDADKVFEKVHTDILKKVTANSTDASYRSFLFDTDDLHAYLINVKAEIDMSLTAADISERVGYQNPKGGIGIFSPANQQYIFPNEPVLVDVVLNRDPSQDVFRLLPLPAGN
jgi:pimeloyl-ACP methyl ester carboxylesterase